MTDGILLVDKPAEWTSFDVVHYVRKIIAVHENRKPKNVKVGHTGTLDPLATGLLILLLGRYTKRAPELIKLDKVYEVTMRLGMISTTGDGEGVLTHVSVDRPSERTLRAALERFTGERSQVPPAYSAVKVNGRRAYALARAGKSFEIEPRKIAIYALELQTYHFPIATFAARVSSGTYIRTLVQDIGEDIGTGAHTSGLRRTSIGEFHLKDAVSVAELTPTAIAANLFQTP